MKDLSVVIVSYNTKEITKQCIDELIQLFQESSNLHVEIIVVDNGSEDKSVEMLKEIKALKNFDIKIIANDENLGFAKANNQGITIADGKYILLLNSDVIIKDVNFEDLIYYMDKNEEVGVLTVRVILADGRIDMASHRGFPTVWSSFTYFTKLEAIFKKVPKLSKIFGRYHLTHLDLNTIHEIDSPSGAFYFTRKSILDRVHGFDTRFFLYGEDLDLSYRIKKLDYKIMYYPLFAVTHLKYRSGLKKGIKKTEDNAKNYFYEAMKVFYDKHFSHKNGKLMNKIVHFFINIKQKATK
jgi:GT2 family glycosyltransferase